MEHGEIQSAAIVAIVVTELFEMAKRSPWVRGITYDSERVNRVVGIVVAFLSGLGLQFQFDAATGRLIVDGLFASTLVHGVAQWAGQMAYYRLAVKRSTHVDPVQERRVTL